MWNPSFDFRLFELPQFSPLQAQEFGAETIFGAADPPWYVDASIASMFQGAEDARSRAREAYEAAVRHAEDARKVLESFGGNVRRGAEVIGGIPGNVKKGAETAANAPGNVVKGAKTLKEFWDAIPAGSGVFLLAILAIVFILLFVKR